MSTPPAGPSTAPTPGPSRRRWRRPLAVVAVLLLLAVAAFAGVRWWRSAHTSDLERALALAPQDTQRYSWTDWDGVRRELGASLDDRPTASQLEGFLDQAYDADLSPMSTLVDAAPLLSSMLGFSPANVHWELFAQSERGALVVLRLGESFSFERLEERLEAAGFERPTAEDDGVWDGLEVLGPAEIPPELSQIVLDPDQRLVRASDSGAYLRSVVRGHTGPSEDVEAVADVSGEPLAAALYAGSWTCSELAMSTASPDDEAQGRELIDAAGKVSPVRAFAMARRPEGSDAHAGELQVALAFADHDQAVANADSRSRLAAGPAPGQGGSFADRFELGEVRAEGPVVTLQLDQQGGAAVLSDLSTGPLLFATC